jgi:hypothetical protein
VTEVLTGKPSGGPWCLGLARRGARSPTQRSRATRFSLPRAGELPIELPTIDRAVSFPVAKPAFAPEDVPTPMEPVTRVLLSFYLMRRVSCHAFCDPG